MAQFYNADLVSLPISVLRKPQTVCGIAAYWDIADLSGELILDTIMDELNLCHEGRLYDFNDQELDLVALKPKALWGAKALDRMKSLKKFKTRETIEVIDLFGEDGRRMINATRRYASIPPVQTLSRALVPRFMMLDFARRIREGRLADAS
ncbi:MAG: hypothetical protein ACSHXZ_14945 [Gammaproteobacteria bacterium]